MTTLCVQPDLTRNFTIVEEKTNSIHFDVFEANDVVLRLAVVDSAGAAVDVSAWTTRAWGIYPPGSGTADATGAPTFETDGTDGIVLVTLADTDLASLAGRRRIEVQVSGTGIKLTPVRGTFDVTETYVS